MRSRRDQVQAHAYVLGRLSSAMVHGEPDVFETPMRRTTMGSFSGLVLGALCVAAFLVWGLISPIKPTSATTALTAWDFIVVPQTGDRYIFTGTELLPVLNWSSARLLLGGNPQVETVSASALTSIPQGSMLGIEGAPDVLPSATAVNSGDWLICAQASGAQPRVIVAIGARPAASPVGPDQADLVAADGLRYLIWDGERLLLEAGWIVQALGLDQAPVTQVSQAWLDTVPSGPDLLPIVPPGAGSAGPSLGGQRTRVGEVLEAHNVGTAAQLYLVERGGVAPITVTQAAVELAGSAGAAAYPGAAPTPVAVSPAAITEAPVGDQPLPDGMGTGAPASPPRGYLAPAGDVPCLAYPGTGTTSPSLIWTTPPSGSPPGTGEFGAGTGATGIGAGAAGTGAAGTGTADSIGATFEGDGSGRNKPGSDAPRGTPSAGGKPGASPGAAQPGTARSGAPLAGTAGVGGEADVISVAPGGGALVRTRPGSGTGGGTVFLVTSGGVKYPVPSSSAVAALGYQSSQEARLPAALLALLPTGPSLDLAPLER
jgi:type VII secretion protein EccB